MPSNCYYVYAEGGFGDIIANYYERLDFRCLPAFKKANPDAYVRLLVTGQNMASPDFFRWHPYIDDIAYSPWLGNIEGFRERKKHQFFHFEGKDIDGNEYPQEHPTIYLSPLERKMVDDIKARGRYVTWQPWGGGSERNFENVFDLEEMIDRILDQDYNLVVVGGCAPKVEWGMHHPIDFIPPSREGHPRVINLLPYSNARICAALVAEGTKHIGTDSCYAVLAALNKVPSLVMTSNNFWDGGCPLIMAKHAWIIHFDIWQRKEADLAEVMKRFLPAS